VIGREVDNQASDQNSSTGCDQSNFYCVTHNSPLPNAATNPNYPAHDTNLFGEPFDRLVAVIPAHHSDTLGIGVIHLLQIFDDISVAIPEAKCPRLRQ
jgi:hypothetical protein